ncbi:hypothetical protein [Limnobacter parvus]|uniref:Retention module-containing protein n=1 Tax=Limnobacter parvus TaxID=2939690 RepID=A0ABT1XJX1_9BURK|nr:hypothetical protein [Limnobacter parvus]MCR2747596.1 hypothetical protein [Limnobacter parvus]
MAAPQALIKDLEGEVSVTRNGEVVTVKAGDFLLPGDEVATGATGRLALEFPGSDGQIPAAGVMTANGKLTLGEQPGANGQQQIVVLEDGECFEFTTELAENSAAAEGGAVAGLFGAGMLGAGSGAVAGAGALAAGAFLGGGSGDSSGGDIGGVGTSTGASGGNGSLIGVSAGEFSSEDSPQSIEEFVNENLTQDNLQESIVEPIQTAIENSQANPESTPDNIAVAGEQLAFAGLENVHDALVAITGEGTPQADLVQQLVDGLNETPLGEPLSPITNPLVDAVNTDLGLDMLVSALPNVNPADGGLVTSVVDLVDDITQPLSQQVEPVDQLMDGLHTVAVEVDGGLNTLVDGILGGADTLQIALEGAGNGSGLPEIPEGDLLGTLSSGISSGADALSEQLGGGLPTDGLLG